MQITPLVLHAQRRLPALSSLFADTFDVLSLSVVAGDKITITCSKPHKLTPGSQVAVTIADATTPNPVIAADIDLDGNLVLQTQYPHNLSSTPNPDKFNPWNQTVKLDGFGVSIIDGTRQIDSIPNKTTVVVMPGGVITSITLDGSEVLLERLERALIGYHRATVVSPTVLTISTPDSITRDFVAKDVVVASSVRVYGSIDLHEIMRVYTRDDKAIPATGCTMFICPIDVRVSRARSGRTDALAEVSDVADLRQFLMDGYDIFVVIPTEKSPSGVAAIDVAHGPIFTAVLKTFFGLNLPRPEFCGGETFVSILDTHGAVAFDRANYVHRYRFQASAVITNADAIQPYDWPDYDPADPTPIDHIYPVGSDPFETIDVATAVPSPDGGTATVSGIRRQDEPGALSGVYSLEPSETP